MHQGQVAGATDRALPFGAQEVLNEARQGCRLVRGQAVERDFQIVRRHHLARVGGLVRSIGPESHKIGRVRAGVGKCRLHRGKVRGHEGSGRVFDRYVRERGGVQGVLRQGPRPWHNRHVVGVSPHLHRLVLAERVRVPGDQVIDHVRFLELVARRNRRLLRPRIERRIPRRSPACSNSGWRTGTPSPGSSATY